jgi:hypothetical protein
LPTSIATPDLTGTPAELGRPTTYRNILPERFRALARGLEALITINEKLNFGDSGVASGGNSSTET